MILTGSPAARLRQLMCHLNNYAKLAARFVGLIEQMPPPFSAKKIKGVPAYKLARKHQEVALKPVQVEIKEFEILAVEGDQASFAPGWHREPTCAPSPTIWASSWGAGRILQSLRRTSLGEFDLSHAHTLEELDAACQAGRDRGFVHSSAPAAARVSVRNRQRRSRPR